MNSQSNNVVSAPNPNDISPVMPPAGAKNAETGEDDEIMIPKSRFDDVNQKAKTLAERVAEYERLEIERQQSVAEDERKRLEEQGKFKELSEKAQADAATLKTSYEELGGRAKRMSDALKTYLDKEMEDVPEWVTPLLEKLDIPERLAWLVENREQWTKHNGNIPPSPSAEKPATMNDDERRKKAFKIRF